MVLRNQSNKSFDLSNSSNNFDSLFNSANLDTTFWAGYGVIAKHFEEPYGIPNIDLSNNALTTLSESLLVWNSTKQVNLNQNPWLCDCKISWLVTSGIELNEGPFIYNVTTLTDLSKLKSPK